MDNLVKQRLVGALILVALAVVFWPIIFVPETDERSDVRVAIPPAPPVDRTPLPEPDNAGLRQSPEALASSERFADVEFPGADEDGEETGEEGSESEPVEPAALPQRDDVIKTPSLDEARDTLESPELDADGLPIAFSLQVATMANKARAETLRDELVAAGYKGYLKSLRRDDRTLYRVLVGPKYSRDQLEPIKNSVDSTWRVESMIIRYLP